jgi:hypothetical protein
MPFVLKSAVEAALRAEQKLFEGEQRPSRFKHSGRWMRLVGSLPDVFNCSLRSVPGLLARYGIAPRKIKSDLCRRELEAADEEEVLAAARKLKAERSAAPVLDGRPSIWLRELLNDLAAIRHGKGAVSKKGAPVRWFEKGCPLIDGEKLRHGRTTEGRYYVDADQAERIKQALRLKLAGQVDPDRRLLTPRECEQQRGLHRGLQRKLVAAGLLNPIGKPRSRRILREELETICHTVVQSRGTTIDLLPRPLHDARLHECLPQQKRVAPPAGFETFNQIQQGFESFGDRYRLSSVTPSFRRAKKSACWRHPRTKVWYYDPEELRGYLEADARLGRARNYDRDAEWHRKRLAGDSYGKIRDDHLAKYEGSIPSGKRGYQLVEKAEQRFAKKMSKS